MFAIANLLFFFSRCVAVDEETFSYIIFEDISPLGFKNIDKQNGLDFDHMKLALKKLAQWHALSAEIISHVILKHSVICGEI